MTRKLDKSRKFGVVVGSKDGSLYFQDGVCFNGAGDEIGAAAPATVVTKPVPVVVPPAETDGVTLEQLQALHPSKIKKLVELRGLVLETGQGSKARNIENLLLAAG